MVEKGSIIVDVIPRRLAGRGDRMPLESAAEWCWNGWPNAAGISGRMVLERMAECRRNQWPNGAGIRIFEQADLQILRPVDGNGDREVAFFQHVMATVDSGEGPTGRLQGFDDLFAVHECDYISYDIHSIKYIS